MSFTVNRYIAVGDSFTEGLWDPHPQHPELELGWADRLAHSLAQRQGHELPLEYANFAIRGRLLEPVITDQLPKALAFQPDLISIVAGGNDTLRPGVHPDQLAAQLDAAVSRARASGARVLMATGIDTRGVPLLSAIRKQVAVYNSHIWSIAHRHGASVLDLWGMKSLRDWRVWSQDRIHLNSEGHRRVAQAALVALGLPPDDPDWNVPLPPQQPAPLIHQLRDDARWLRRDVYPWATRRFRGGSTGANRSGKYPKPVLITP